MTDFLVMTERCDQCLYGPNKIVSDARRRQILREVDAADDYFICHKATIAATKACCAGDYESRGGGRTGRLARLLGLVREVTSEQLEATTL